MTDTIYNNAILCAALSFAEDKIRPNQTSDKGKFLSSLALVLNGTATCTAVYVHHTEKLVFIARNESITETNQQSAPRSKEVDRRQIGTTRSIEHG